MLPVAPPEVPLPFHLSKVVRALEDAGQEVEGKGAPPGGVVDRRQGETGHRAGDEAAEDNNFQTKQRYPTKCRSRRKHESYPNNGESQTKSAFETRTALAKQKRAPMLFLIRFPVLSFISRVLSVHENGRVRQPPQVQDPLPTLRPLCFYPHHCFIRNATKGGETPSDNRGKPTREESQALGLSRRKPAAIGTSPQLVAETFFCSCHVNGQASLSLPIRAT